MTTKGRRCFVVGVGMTKFEQPGRREGWDYPDMAREAGTKALEDAGIDYRDVEQGYVGSASLLYMALQAWRPPKAEQAHRQRARRERRRVSVRSLCVRLPERELDALSSPDRAD